ncbi:MAG TPA: hypothetical protein VFX16_32655 [Pseudonocardiaceae bacterium]|nr:hypothetical protein [Pseudonocardiaceae bacterium]
MSMTSTSERVRTFLDPRPARWSTVLLLSIVLAYADGFVITSLTGAVGAIQRTSGLFGSWLIQSAILVPFFVAAMLLILKRIRRKNGLVLGTAKKVMTAALLLSLAGTVVGVIGVSASSAYDYYLQANELDVDGPLHNHTTVTIPGAAAAASDPHAAHGACDEICIEKRQTLVDDLRGIGLSGPIMLVSNAILVGWLVMLLGGQLSPSMSRRKATAAAEAPPSSRTVVDATPPGLQS